MPLMSFLRAFSDNRMSYSYVNRYPLARLVAGVVVGMNAVRRDTIAPRKRPHFWASLYRRSSAMALARFWACVALRRGIISSRPC